jgi:hypothetical protein
MMDGEKGGLTVVVKGDKLEEQPRSHPAASERISTEISSNKNPPLPLTSDVEVAEKTTATPAPSKHATDTSLAAWLVLLGAILVQGVLFGEFAT